MAPGRSKSGQNPGSDEDPSNSTPSYLERAFTLLLSSELDDPTYELLELVGRELNVSRTYLFRFRDGGLLMDNTHEWCAPGVVPEIDRLQNLPTDAFPWWMRELRSGAGIVVPDVSRLPDAAGAERDILQAQGVHAVLVLPLLDRVGRLEGFLGFDDVTGPRDWSDAEIASLRLISQLGIREMERERTARAIRRLEVRLTLTEQIARVGGWELDPATGLAWWSAQTYDLLGTTPSHAPLTLDDFMGRLDPADRERARGYFTDALHGGGSFRFECRTSTPDASEPRVLEVQGSMCDIDGRSQALVGTLQDVTERVRLEETVRNARTMEAVGQLAGGVAHDFNNLLSVILGSTRFLLDEQNTESAQRADLVQIRDAAQRGAGLVRQLLAFGRRQVLEPGPVDLPGLLNGFDRTLKHAVQHRIAIRISTRDDPGPVFMDRAQLEQILLSLAVNARDAMPEGGRLSLTTGEHTVAAPLGLPAGQILRPGRYATIDVEDDGHGMDPRTLSRIFDPFFSTKPPERGSGLGLPSAYGVLQQSGGGIGVESTPGSGSRFTLYLPTRPADPFEPVLPRSHGGSGRYLEGHVLQRGEGSPAHLREYDRPANSGFPPRTILVVSDNPAVLRFIRRVIEGGGHTVLASSSNAKALSWVQQASPSIDLLITEVSIRGSKGRDLAAEIRRDRPGIPVLFTTAHPVSIVFERGIVDAGETLLSKPFTASELLQAMEHLLAGPDPLPRSSERV